MATQTSPCLFISLAIHKLQVVIVTDVSFQKGSEHCRTKTGMEQNCCIVVERNALNDGSGEMDIFLMSYAKQDELNHFSNPFCG